MQAPLAVVVGPFSTVNSAPGLKGTSHGMKAVLFFWKTIASLVVFTSLEIILREIQDEFVIKAC